jgi:hypothetical protein
MLTRVGNSTIIQRGQNASKNEDKEPLVEVLKKNLQNPY